MVKKLTVKQLAEQFSERHPTSVRGGLGVTAPKGAKWTIVALPHHMVDLVSIGGIPYDLWVQLQENYFDNLCGSTQSRYLRLPQPIYDFDEYCPECGLHHSFEFAVTVIQLDGRLTHEETLTCTGEDCPLNIVKPQPTKKMKRTSRIDLVVPCFKTDEETGERVQTGVTHMDVNYAFRNSDNRRRKATPEQVSKKLRNTDDVTAYYEGIKLPTEPPVESRPRRRPLPQARRGGPQKTAPEETGEEAQNPDSLENVLATFQKQNSF